MRHPLPNGMHLCDCGHIQRDDGVAVAIAERVDAAKAVVKGAVRDAGGAVVEIAKDVEDSVGGSMQRAFDRVFGTSGPRKGQP